MTSAATALAPRETPKVPGLPLLGSVLDMAKDPARFFLCLLYTSPSPRD